MKLFSHGLLGELTTRAAASPRGRAHHNIHEAATDPVQRFFVVANRNSYFRPHRHATRSPTDHSLLSRCIGRTGFNLNYAIREHEGELE